MSGSATCENCGAALEAGDRFCNSCGASARLCAECATPLAPGDSLCPKCGAAAALPGTRVASVPPLAPASGPGSPSAWDRVLDRLRVATQNQFEIRRELGRGGMAAVYLANEIGLSRLVAIKVMSPGLLMDDAMVERFRQEAVTLANLNHAHIVPIFAVREVDDLHFFVMKFIEGRPLDEIIRDASPLSIPLVQAILFQVGSALASAHRRGIIHRDIKPANILLDVDGNAIVTDFGIAKVAEVPGQTQTGSMVGTPTYMSPEQCRGDVVGIGSDQYSLGVVAYELLTGKPPFTGPTLMVMQAHTEKIPQSIRALRPDCPAELESVVLRMLDKDPAKRWASTTEAATAAGGRALAEEDPVRSQLATLASVGIERPARGTPVGRPPATPSRPASDAVARPTPAAAAARPAVTPSPAQPNRRLVRWLLPLGAVIVVVAVAALLALRGARAPVNNVGVPAPQAPPLAAPSSAGANSALLPPPPAPIATSTAPPTAKVATILIAPHDSVVTAGSHFLLRATARGTRRETIDGAVIHWHSSNPAIITIDSTTGEGTALQVEGSARISARATGAATAIAIRVSGAQAAPDHAPSTLPAQHPAPVATAPPPPPPAAAPPPPAAGNTRTPVAPDPAATPVPTALEVDPLIDGCVSAFSSGKKDRITAAYGAPSSAQDSKNRDELVNAAGRDLVAKLSTAMQSHVTGANLAEASFQLTFTYSPNSFTRSTQTAGPYPFKMLLQRSGNVWKSAGCHSDAAMKLH
jgi:predicted Ser/Thr protein kinase